MTQSQWMNSLIREEDGKILWSIYLVSDNIPKCSKCGKEITQYQVWDEKCECGGILMCIPDLSLSVDEGEML